MTRSHRLTSFSILLTALTAACADAPTAPSVEAPAFALDRSPIELSFTKCAVAEGVWQGVVSGDIEGTVETMLLHGEAKGAVTLVDFRWTIDAGPQSFVADLSGILSKGFDVTMNGEVSSGYLAGARVHEEGQLVDPANLCFAGKIMIFPATAD